MDDTPAVLHDGGNIQSIWKDTELHVLGSGHTSWTDTLKTIKER